MVSIDPADGSTGWAQIYDDLTLDMLPVLEPAISDVLVPDGRPVAETVDVVRISENKVWTNLVLGCLYYGMSSRQE